MDGGVLPLLKVNELEAALGNVQKPIIPHIIHQTWDTHDVPSMFIPWIKSVVEKHPNWTYLFWTEQDILCYFKQRHVDFLELYNSYGPMIFKTDVMRYFLMYDYGGFYLDLDIECLKALDPWSHYAPCVLTHETYEHSFLVKKQRDVEVNVMTTVLASRPQHPYFKLLQQSLLEYHAQFPTDVLRATGPLFMNDILQRYFANRNDTDGDNDVAVINPVYWLPTFDPFLKQKIKYMCDNKYRQLKTFVKNLCDFQIAAKFLCMLCYV